MYKNDYELFLKNSKSQSKFPIQANTLKVKMRYSDFYLELNQEVFEDLIQPWQDMSRRFLEDVPDSNAKRLLEQVPISFANELIATDKI